MSGDMENFIEEGMKKYKEASYVLVKFGKEIESRLQKILKDRQEWGAFIPKKKHLQKVPNTGLSTPYLTQKLTGNY